MYRLTELTPALVPACARILRQEWPMITDERLYQVVNSVQGGSSFPCSLVMMLQHQQSATPVEILAHCRITGVLNYPTSTYIESIVVDKSRRGQGHGERILNLAEDYVKSRGITHMFISCLVEKASYFTNHGYCYVEPKVVTRGSAMLGSSGPPPYAVSLPGWEHLYANIQTVSDLIEEEDFEDASVTTQKGCSADALRDDNTQKGNSVDSDSQKRPKMRTVRYNRAAVPELSIYGYAWIAKEL